MLVHGRRKSRHCAGQGGFFISQGLEQASHVRGNDIVGIAAMLRFSGGNGIVDDLARGMTGLEGGADRGLNAGGEGSSHDRRGMKE